MVTHQSALTPILDFFPSSEVVTIWQTDGTAHKLELRSFHKSTHLLVHSVDFHPWCELHLTLIKTITCLLQDLLVVMLIFGFSFLSSLIVLYTSSIFFNERLGKFFLILRISLMLEKNVCAYICSFWFLLFLMTFLPFFWKNFNFLKTSLLSLGGIGEGILEISALFPDFLDSFFFSGLLCEFLCVNLAEIYWWNDLLLWLVFKISYPTS